MEISEKRKRSLKENMLNFQNKPLKLININKYCHILLKHILLKILPLGLASKNDIGAPKKHICISFKRMVAILYPTTIRSIPLTSMPKEHPLANKDNCRVSNSRF